MGMLERSRKIRKAAKKYRAVRDYLPNRHHKGMTFRPIWPDTSKKVTTRREVNKFLKKSREGETVADNRFYRVYKHKRQGGYCYVVYMADRVKHRYGGTRRRR